MIKKLNMLKIFKKTLLNFLLTIKGKWWGLMGHKFCRRSCDHILKNILIDQLANKLYQKKKSESAWAKEEEKEEQTKKNNQPNQKVKNEKSKRN